MNSKYELLKDLPGFNAGSIINWNPGYDRYVMLPENFKNHNEGIYFTQEQMNANPTWFKKLPDRIEVAHFAYENMTNYYWFVTKDLKRIPLEKYPLIRQAIERVLNDEECEWQTKPMKDEEITCPPMKVYVSGIEYIHPKELDKVMEDAFNAARKTNTSDYMYNYPTFESYIKSIKQ